MNDIVAVFGISLADQIPGRIVPVNRRPTQRVGGDDEPVQRVVGEPRRPTLGVGLDRPLKLRTILMELRRILGVNFDKIWRKIQPVIRADVETGMELPEVRN